MISPSELIERGREICEGDLGTVLCWLINSEPADERARLHLDVCNALRSMQLTGMLSQEEEIRLPDFFGREDARTVWDELTDAIQPKADAKFIESLSFLNPKSAKTFVPHAFPCRWTPSEWDKPLTPREVRDALGLADCEHRKDLTNLRLLMQRQLKIQPNPGLTLVVSHAAVDG